MNSKLLGITVLVFMVSSIDAGGNRNPGAFNRKRGNSHNFDNSKDWQQRQKQERKKIKCQKRQEKKEFW